MIKNKIIFSIFSAISFANFSFGMDDLANEFNGMALNEYENEYEMDETTATYQAELIDAYVGIAQLEAAGLPVMTPEQEQRFNNANTVKRRLNFNF